MAIEIKPAPAEFGNWEALMALLHAAFAFQHSRIDPPSSLHRFDAKSIAVKAKEEQLFLALDGGELVGCIFAKPQAGALYVGKMAVRPGRQGQGIGRRLMQAAEGMARKSGLGLLELETRVELTENHAAFAAMGFVKVSEGMHPGYDRTTSITMRKTLG